MKNITVAVPDEVYRQARVVAAERGESVSRMVADYLESLQNAEARFDRLLALQNSILAEIDDFSGADRLSRDELYDRAVR